MSSESLFLGIDVGGTNVKLAIVDAAGEIRFRESVATPTLGSSQRVYEHAIEFASKHAPVQAVGLAVPGVLDTRQLVLREVVNLPGWVEQPLGTLLAEASQLPCAVLNDANAAAYAEHHHRHLQTESLALVTLGTGVGCGLVAEGNPYGGDHGCAGELGHIAVEFGSNAMTCTCGAIGHLETYAGSGGVIARLHQAIAESNAPVSDELASDQLTTLQIAEAAESGDEISQKVIDQTAEYVGRAIGMVGQVIDPAVVLLGGAMTFGGNKTNTGRRFLEHVREHVKRTTLVQVGENLEIDFASLGNDAGVLGAAMVAKREKERQS